MVELEVTSSKLYFLSQTSLQQILLFLINQDFCAKLLPASTIAALPVSFRGRTLNVAGDRTFESWSVNIINDTDFAIRSAFENWMNTINRVSDNTGVTDPTLYQADAFVYQLDRDGSTLRAYHMYDIFPTNITAIDLSYDQEGIEEFTVEFQILWWEAIRGNSPNAGGIDIN